MQIDRVLRRLKAGPSVWRSIWPRVTFQAGMAVDPGLYGLKLPGDGPSSKLPFTRILSPVLIALEEASLDASNSWISNAADFRRRLVGALLEGDVGAVLVRVALVPMQVRGAFAVDEDHCLFPRGNHFEGEPFAGTHVVVVPSISVERDLALLAAHGPNAAGSIAVGRFLHLDFVSDFGDGRLDRGIGHLGAIQSAVFALSFRRASIRK